MPINKGSRFNERDIFIDYSFEEVMFRWDYLRRQIFRKFYGEPEGSEPVPHDNRLFNDALLYGDEIPRAKYFDS